MKKQVNVFFSYSHKDEEQRQELLAHLSGLKRGGLIREWHDRKILAGEEWKGEIDKNLEGADLILLLVSAYFIASDYCYEKEMKRALERRAAGEAWVVPIIVRDCEWHTTPIGALQALPTEGKPVLEWPSKDAAWADVARGIRKVVESLTG